MLCVLCRFQSAAGERGHSARFCPLRELECRHTLSEDSPFVICEVSGRWVDALLYSRAV